MEQIAFVRRVIKDKVELEIKRTSACGSCDGCGGGCAEEKSHIILIDNKLNAKVGDFVEIHGDKKSIFKYAAITYLIPFSFLIAGVLIGDSIFRTSGHANYELLSFAVGVVALAISYLIIRAIDSKIAKSEESAISMTKIL